MTDWQDDAACKGMDADLFFPEVGENATDTAKAVCRTCPVCAECLEYALTERITHGVWGGLSEKQRRKIRGERVRAGLLPRVTPKPKPAPIASIGTGVHQGHVAYRDFTDSWEAWP